LEGPLQGLLELLHNALVVDNSYKLVGGDLFFVGEDLILFGFDYLSNEALQSETRDLFWTPQKTHDGENTNYGIG
tara:strand:- start:1412 stop:1636 length:225 start_codon:yes stop_codon:yes gene_type:complete